MQEDLRAGILAALFKAGLFSKGSATPGTFFPSLREMEKAARKKRPSWRKLRDKARAMILGQAMRGQ